MKKVAVIGAGTMGNGIAHVFAMNGFTTHLVDVNEKQLEKAIATITKNLDRMVVKGSISEEVKAKTLNNLITFFNTNDGVNGVELVVEAATENVDLKLKIFKQWL